MVLLLTIDQCDPNYIVVGKRQKNKVMDQSSFYKFVYHSPDVSLYNLFLDIQFTNVVIDKHYNKFRLSFNVDENKEMIDHLSYLERNIVGLSEFDDTYQVSYTLRDQLLTGVLKSVSSENVRSSAILGSHNQCSIALKISGIWEAKGDYGLIFKWFF